MRSCLEAIGAAALLLSGCAEASPPADRTATADRAAIEVKTGHSVERIMVALDRAAVDPASDHVVTPLGTRGDLLLLVDSYASRRQGLSRCQAGHESWVRLIDLRARAERWSRLAQSCLHDIEPGEPIAAWTGTGADFIVNSLSRPAIHVTVEPSGRISADGG